MKKLFPLFGIFLFLSACSESTLVKRACPYLGTIVEVKVADRDKPRQVINKAIDSAFAEIERVENLLSKFKPESDIARINASGSIKPVKVSAETMTLLEKSIYFSRLSDGAYDVTIGPLMEIWGFSQKGKMPPAAEITQVLPRIGYQKIILIPQERCVCLSEAGMSLDLGSIAKGYAVDRAIAVLKKEGISNALVNAGGDIYALGKRDALRQWRIALQHPRQKNAILTVLDLENKAVATSGDYQRYIEIAGRRYSHIINPKTGYPCQDVPASVTVIAGDCLSADALATAIFVLGPKNGMALVNRLDNVEGIVGSMKKDELDVLLSQGLQKRLKFKL